MAELTEELQREVQAAGDVPLRLTDPATNREYILLRAELFDRLKGLLCADGEFSVSETYPLMDDVLAKAGWADPEMDVYDDLTSPEKP
jgi:hypothetical protein